MNLCVNLVRILISQINDWTYKINRNSTDQDPPNSQQGLLPLSHQTVVNFFTQNNFFRGFGTEVLFYFVLFCFVAVIDTETMQQSFPRSGSGSLQITNNTAIPQHSKSSQSHQQILKRQGTLTLSQTANLQQQHQYREALAARVKLNSHKSFNLEDDLEFYPNHIDTRSKINSRSVLQGPLSPYTTPTKVSGMQGFSSNQRINSQHSGYVSSHLLDSPQQQSHHIGFTSPNTGPGNNGMVRRLDIPSNSLYQQGPNSRTW